MAIANGGSNIVLNIDGELYYNNIIIATYINKSYTKIKQNLVDKLAKSSGRFSYNPNLFRNYYINEGVTSTVKFTIKPVSADHVSLQLVAFNIKSTDIDNILVYFLKDDKENITTPVTHITNLSILSVEIHQKLKQACITPLFTKNSWAEIGNYKPVNKVDFWRKIVYNQRHTQ